MHLDVGRIWSGGDRRRQFMGALLVGMAIVLSLAPAAAPAAAQDARPAAALAEDLVERFEVLPLSRGIVLRPRFGGDYRAVEIAAGGAAVDGDKVNLRELAERVTDEEDLALIQELLALSARGRRDVLLAVENADSVAPRPPAPPELPQAPEAAAAPEAPDLPAVPEAPEAPEPPRISHSDAEVAVGSHIVVEEGETSDDVVVFGGSITVEGEVKGDAVALGGSIEVNGPVSGDVVAVGGSVDLGPEADVGGEVVSVGGKVNRDPAARVAGKVSEAAFGSGLRGLRALRQLERRGDLDDHDEWGDWSFSPFDRVSGLVWGLVKIGLLALLACLALLLARRSVERIGARAAAEAWRSGATGLVAQILFVPVLVITVVVLAVSIIGVPLLLLVPFALVGLVIAAFVGYAAVAHRLGRWVESRFGWAHRSDLQSLLIGVVTIEMWRVLARLLDWGPLGFVSFLVTAFGFLVAYLAWTVGFGAMLLTLFSEGGPLARRRARLAGMTPIMPPPASAAPIVDPQPPEAEWTDEEPITPADDLEPRDPRFDERDPEERKD